MASDGAEGASLAGVQVNVNNLYVHILYMFRSLRWMACRGSHYARSIHGSTHHLIYIDRDYRRDGVICSVYLR